MSEKYILRLTKVEAKQLFANLLIIEDLKFKKKPSKKYWENHEKLIGKLQIIIYDSKNEDKTTKETI